MFLLHGSEASQVLMHCIFCYGSVVTAVLGKLGNILDLIVEKNAPSDGPPAPKKQNPAAKPGS